MEMTDLKTAIDDYTDAAESGILGLKDRLDAMETKMAPPGDAGSAICGDALEHKHAFLNGFITKGDDSLLKDLEAKGLSTATGGDGGFAVPTVIDSEIEKQLRDLSPMRSICKVKTIETSKYTRLVSASSAGMSGWVGETFEDDERDKTATPTLAEVTIIPGEICANAAATQRALDDMQFDAEAWLTEEVAEEFAAQEGAAVIDGDGVNKPRGFLLEAAIGKVTKRRLAR